MLIFLLAVNCGITAVSFAQAPFNSCPAAFIPGKMIVNNYSPTGQCRLSAAATGKLTVQTVALSPTKNKAVDKIDFHVAIRDKATNTLRMFSNKTYQQLPVQQVLITCKKGDRIVLLTVNNQYALPHNEILVK
ncbi:hypothetical protein [Spirosoma luteum]|uniref:hypothetical protein n=1 Tax=Spirosoma luteum TaxID=431553 RepID=UPI00037D64F6|nr:hypothetical protein [Spirosoma luteum]